jgi:hypothetical protein
MAENPRTIAIVEDDSELRGTLADLISTATTRTVSIHLSAASSNAAEAAAAPSPTDPPDPAFHSRRYGWRWSLGPFVRIQANQ